MLMLKTRRLLGAFGLLSDLTLIVAFTLTPVYANPNGPKNEKPKSEDPPEWSDPTVSGIVTQTFWAEGKDPKNKTATIVVWSNDIDMAVSVYGDNPIVREAIVNGTACVGRYVVATGDRIDTNALSAQGIEVPNLDMPCTATLQ
jgi:hypothetical protein